MTTTPTGPSHAPDHKFGCAVVVDAGKVVGVFTATDALRVKAKLVRARELR